MKTIEGDLLKYFDNKDFDVIVHGCNCFHTMGAGIALQIKRKYTQAYDADCRTEYGSKMKLGTYSFAVFGEQTIVNAYTQYDTGGPRAVDYDAIRKVFKALANTLYGCGLRIGIPFIGAGLAGGDWDVISEIIDEATPGLDITAVKYKP